MVQYYRSDAVGGFDIGPALVNGLLIAIPIWVVLGILLALVFQEGPMGETGSAALMIAAACEAILLRPLLRPYARKLQAGIRRYADHRRAASTSDLEKATGRRFYSIEDLLRYVESGSVPLIQARPVVAPYSILRQALTLSALVGAYLQYYFLEVELQIAALRPLTVFVPVTSMT